MTPETRARRLAYNKAYRQRPEVKEREKLRRKMHGKEWYAVSRDKKLAYQKNYQVTHRQEIAAYQKEWRKRPEAQDRHIKPTYGITMAEKHAMLEQQGGRCAICRTDEPRGHGWMVDHDHDVGHIRGILCHHCNMLLGQAKDSVFILRAAIEYLRRANSWWENDIPPKLREMSERQAELDEIARATLPN